GEVLTQPRNLVAVVVPHHTTDLTADETISIRHLTKHLGRYDKYLVCPRGLKVDHHDFAIKRFNDKHFSSVFEYCKLLMSSGFYESFTDYKYILIYQLDALVFSDQLLEWCSTDLDYIGAPWLKDRNMPEQGFSSVGNGGLSLRKVESHIKVLHAPGNVIDPVAYWEEFCLHNSRLSQLFNLHKKYLKRLEIFSDVKWYSRHPHDMEDVFWGTLAPRLCPEFKVASVKQALRFAFEVAPRYCFEQSDRQLPFGCHAWNKYDRGFWEPYLLRDY
ncbi:MAG: DUF5672 family protein, partial [Candidatus Sulfotelmatobacter sp.]